MLNWKQIVQNHSRKIILALAIASLVAMFADPWCYLAYCSRTGARVLGIFNPARMLTYALTPIGVAI